jgi:hypothetical protein
MGEHGTCIPKKRNGYRILIRRPEGEIQFGRQ